MQAPHVCLQSGLAWPPPSWISRTKRTAPVSFIFSFTVAMHHLLRKITASHQNIKMPDIYLEGSCVCVCVFSVYLITVFTTFHFVCPPLPLPLSSNAQTVPTRLLAVHFKLTVFASVRFAVRARDGGNEEKRKNLEKLTVKVSGYSLMLTERSVKTGVKCSIAMKDWMLMFHIACTDRQK